MLMLKIVACTILLIAGLCLLGGAYVMATSGAKDWWINVAAGAPLVLAACAISAWGLKKPRQAR